MGSSVYTFVISLKVFSNINICKNTVCNLLQVATTCNHIADTTIFATPVGPIN